jgi:hypothetical protein
MKQGYYDKRRTDEKTGLFCYNMFIGKLYYLKQMYPHVFKQEKQYENNKTYE